MELFKNKYNELFNDIFTEEGKELTNIKEETEEPTNYPEPTKYRISTMTMITSFNCNINLGVVSKYFTLDNKIISMVYGDKPVKSSNIKKNNRPFFNQATIIVKLNPLKNINIKIFSNGKIQMTGVKRKEDGEKALNLIIEKLKLTKGLIPIEKLLDSQLIKYYLELTNTHILDESFYEMNKDNKPFLNRVLIIDKINEIITKKVIMNYESINGTKPSDTQIKEYIESKELDMLFAESIEDLDQIHIENIDIVLINSDFNINFKIKRNNLYSILSKDYQITTRYEPCIYPGVNSKYYWNKAYENFEYEGKCYCSKPCIGKGKGNGDGDCKKITIAAFQSGSVIITGAREIIHIEKAQAFINRVFRENYDLIRKIDAPFIEKTVEKKAKKYVKTSNIIVIHKNGYKDQQPLDNKFNKDIYPKYLAYLKKNSKKSTIF